MKKLKDLFINLKATWKYAKKYKKYLFLYLIVMLLLIGISIAVPLLSASLLLNITDNALSKVLLVAFAIFILEICHNVFSYFSRKASQLFYIKVLNDLQVSLADETLKLDMKEIDDNSSGLFIDRLTKDTRKMADVFGVITYHIMDILENIGVLGAIFIVNKILFLYVIISIVVIFFFERIRIKKWYEQSKEVRKLDEQNSGLIAELVRGIRDVKILNSAKDFMLKITGRINDANMNKYKLDQTMRRYFLLTGCLKDISDFLFIALGVFLVSTNNLTVDSLIVIYMYQSRTFNLLYSIIHLNEQTKEFSLSSERIFEIIDGKFKKEEFGKTHVDKVKGNFEFKNVNFSYDKKNKVLNNLSFKIKENETVAFVGKSGGGKTTIFSLIDKLYKVDSGEILIDNININDLDKDSIRNNISIITQNPYIFNFTIKENLKIAKNDATDEEIIEACKNAQLHDFIMTLDNKYDTLVGEGGLKLSGGQRQRLAIARALLKKTEIILFDEATSALDNETQKQIQTAINNMKGEYTILIIAHRLSTVIDSDRIIFIENGHVLAEGNHKYLMENCQEYRNLYETKEL